MDKKILIGSIIAICILIGVSFTSVVGYQSKQSNSKLNSPLFGIRSSRVIYKEDKDFNCNYLGINKGNTISVPKRNTEGLAYQTVMDKIRMMDENTYNRVVELFMNNFQKGINSNSESINEIIATLESDNVYNTKEPLATVVDPVCLTTNSVWHCFITWLFLFIVDFCIKISVLLRC